MGDTNLTSVAGAVKRVYDDYVEQQQNLSHRTIDEFAKSSKKYQPGAGFYGAIDDYGNESVGAINEEEQFRTIDSEHYSQWKVAPKVIIAPIQFSGLSAEALQGDDESFVNVVVDALDKSRERLMKDENRQIFGLGTGAMGSPSTTISSLATSFTVDSAQYFRANMVVDIFTSTGGTSKIASARISDVDKVNGILYMAATLGTALVSTDVIVKENILDSAPSDGKEMMGLRGMVDDGTDLSTFQSIDATAIGNLVWRGRRIDASSSNLTSDLLQRLLDDVAVLGGLDPDLILMHKKQRRKYLDIVVPQKRYADGKMDSGFVELEFNGMKLVIDEDCQTDTVYAINKKMIKKFEVAPLAMGTHEGSDKFLRLSNYDVYQAYWRHYANYGTSKRNAHGKIIGLAAPSGVS